MNEIKSLAVGDVVDRETMNSLRSCPYRNFIAVKCGKPLFTCGFGFGACRSGGCCYRFSVFFKSFKCTWVCPNILGMPNSEV